MEKIIKMAFIRVGIRVDLEGFTYLCKGVELGLKNPALLHRVCKGLYTKIAEECNTQNVACVERSIRHAIDQTYINKSFLELNRMFKTQIVTIDDKPTSSQLIKLIVEYINLELYKEETN